MRCWEDNIGKQIKCLSPPMVFWSILLTKLPSDILRNFSSVNFSYNEEVGQLETSRRNKRFGFFSVEFHGAQCWSSSKKRCSHAPVQAPCNLKKHWVLGFLIWNHLTLYELSYSIKKKTLIIQTFDPMAFCNSPKIGNIR